MRNRISCCIDMMFSYCDFYERLSEVKKAGIDTVEFWKWSDKDISRIEESGLQVSVFNLDSRDETLSMDLSRGILNDGRADDFWRALEESIPVYQRLKASAMIVLIGDNAPCREENILKCLTAAKPVLEKENVNLVVEPLNCFDRKGYVMPWAGPVLELLKKVNSPHVKLLYDMYHQNTMGDFSMAEIRKNLDLIGHFHVADVPGRQEPGTGNVDYVSILKELSSWPYEGYIGLEYRASKRDGETFGFLKEAGLLV